MLSWPILPKLYKVFFAIFDRGSGKKIFRAQTMEKGENYMIFFALERLKVFFD